MSGNHFDAPEKFWWSLKGAGETQRHIDGVDVDQGIGNPFEIIERADMTISCLQKDGIHLYARRFFFPQRCATAWKRTESGRKQLLKE